MSDEISKGRVIPGLQLSNGNQNITFLPNRKDLGRFCQDADTGTVVESEGLISSPPQLHKIIYNNI